MLRAKIVIDGKAYPCRETMGAMLRFKEETGEEVSVITGSLDYLVTYLWCCTVSGCKREGVEFDMDLMTFADGLDFDELAKMQGGTEVASTEVTENTEGEEKKS